MKHYPADPAYTITTDSSLIDVNMVHAYLSEQSYWAKDIPLETVARSIQHSFCFAVFHAQQQIGFARLVTDRATFAYLCDVFILPDHRGKGLSKWLIEEIQAYPELQGLRRWMLGTRDAHGLYAQFGWVVIDESVRTRFMQRHFPDVYTTQ